MGYSGGLVTQEWVGVLSMEDIAAAGAAAVCLKQDGAATTALSRGPEG